MVAFSHTALGAGIGLLTYQTIGQSQPIVGLFGAAGINFVAHYIADAVPHGHFFPIKDYKKKIIYVILFDLSLSILLFSAKAFVDFRLGWEFWYILVGILASQAPDALDGLVYIGILPRKGIINLEHVFHEKTHWHGVGPKSLLLGIRDFWQAAVIIISFFFI